MARSIYNDDRSKFLGLRKDANGVTYAVHPNGRKHYYLTTAITANSTADDAVAAAPVAGDTAETSHATGKGINFVSDGAKWQVMTESNLSPGANVPALTEDGEAIGGTNDGDLPDLTAAVGTDIAAFTDPPSSAEMALLRTFVNALKADNAALRAAVRENAATINALIASLEGNNVLASE
jgi:hypothetical protein